MECFMTGFQVITVTDAAAERVGEILADRPEARGIRIGVKNGGCAGMEYDMSWAEEIGKFDEVVDEKGVKVVITSGRTTKVKMTAATVYAAM